LHVVVHEVLQVESGIQILVQHLPLIQKFDTEVLLELHVVVVVG
jgi:hypothetical protein